MCKMEKFTLLSNGTLVKQTNEEPVVKHIPKAKKTKRTNEETTVEGIKAPKQKKSKTVVRKKTGSNATPPGSRLKWERL